MQNKKIEFYKHNLSIKDKRECLKALNSLFLTTGNIVDEFEQNLAKYLGVNYAVGVTSCTDALFLSLKYFGITTGDEVITTPLSFISTATVIEHCGAKPVFIDVEESTGNINADLIEKAITDKTKAIIIVHLYGHMCDMKKIKNIANKYKLPVIEDSAHCVEGMREGVKPGNLGNCACFSFYATKNITSGEGGAIVCNSKKMYEWLKKARLHGMSKNAAERYTKKYSHWDMEFLGYKCNMYNIQAALLLNQLDRIEIFLKRRERIAKEYNLGFKNNPFINLPKILPNIKHARYIYTVWIDKSKRDEYINQLQDKGIGVAVNFTPIHLKSYFRKKYNFKKNDFPIAEKIGNSTISIPFYPKLKKEEIDFVIKTLNSITLKPS